MSSLDDLVSNIKNGVLAIGRLNTTIQTVFPQQTGTSTSATTGAASALPADPAGYLIVTLPNGGGTVKVPYYNQ